MQSLNEKYGLDKRTIVEFIGPQHLAIVKFVKRRIIVADAERIVAVAEQIHAVDPDMKVSLLCFDNICSKSIALLAKAGIDVLTGEPEA